MPRECNLPAFINRRAFFISRMILERGVLCTKDMLISPCYAVSLLDITGMVRRQQQLPAAYTQETLKPTGNLHMSATNMACCVV